VAWAINYVLDKRPSPALIESSADLIQCSERKEKREKKENTGRGAPSRRHISTKTSTKASEILRSS
jgi:hypothetical protein